MERALATFERFSRFTLLLFVGLPLLLLFGCNWNAEIASSQPDGHQGGHLLKLPDGVNFQMEFTLDEIQRRVLIHVQERDTHKPHPLAAETLDAKFESGENVYDVVFTADPRADDPEGRSSRFALSRDELPQQLLSSNHLHLQLSFATGAGTVSATMQHKNDHGHKYRHD